MIALIKMSKKESPKPVTFTVLDRPLKWLKLAGAVMDISASQVLNDVVEYVSENVDEKKIWDDWKENYDDFEDRLEEAKESKSESESESESEEDEEEAE